MANIADVDQAEAKVRMRKKQEAIRSALSEDERRTASSAICTYAYELCERSADSSGTLSVFTFVPFRSEVNVWPLIERLWESGCTVITPRVNRAERALHLYEVTGAHDLEAGNWGIMEPKADAKLVTDLARIDAIIVPGLAFDRLGGRLGYGAGFYDRLFRRYETEGIAFPARIGVAFLAQLVERVPMESHDYRVDWVVTEEGMWKVSE